MYWHVSLIGDTIRHLISNASRIHGNENKHVEVPMKIVETYALISKCGKTQRIMHDGTTYGVP